MKTALYTLLGLLLLTGSVHSQEFYIENMAYNEVEHPPLPESCKNVPRPEAEACFKKALKTHIREHFQYPPEAFASEIQGRVIVDFEIDRGGRVANIQAKGAHALLEEEARRIISLLPPMNPGRHQGQPVAVKLSVPIPFKLVAN